MAIGLDFPFESDPNLDLDHDQLPSESEFYGDSSSIECWLAENLSLARLVVIFFLMVLGT